MSITSAHDEATNLADDFVTLHNSLVLARASYADIKKKTEAKNFYTVHWVTFEKGPINSDEVIKQLEAYIKDKETAFVAAKEGLEGALACMHQGEQILWWNHCERLFSSVEPLKLYKPVIVVPFFKETVENDNIEGTTDEYAAEGTVEGCIEDHAAEEVVDKDVTEAKTAAQEEREEEKKEEEKE